MYRLTSWGGVTISLDDGSTVVIPNADDNVDWQAYQAWLKGGHTPEPAPDDLAIPPQPEPNIAELKAQLLALQAQLAALG